MSGEKADPRLKYGGWSLMWGLGGGVMGGVFPVSNTKTETLAFLCQIIFYPSQKLILLIKFNIIFFNYTSHI